MNVYILKCPWELALSSKTTEGMYIKHSACIINVDILGSIGKFHLKFESTKSI